MKIARIVAAFVFVVQLFLPLSAYAADSASYSFATTINVSENFSATVRTIVEVDTSVGALPSTLLIPAYGTNLSSINANLADNKPLTIEARDDKLSLLMSPASNSSSPLISFEVSYTTQIAKRLGKSALVTIPPSNYEGLKISKESLSINSDPSLGIPLVRGGKPTSSQEGIGTISHTWSSETGAIKQASGLLYGDNAVAKLTFKTTLQNDGLWWKTTSVTLPPDTNQQRIFVTSLSPQPKTLKLDRDGNMIAEYRLGPRQKIDVTAEMTASLNNYVYKLEQGLSLDTIDRVLVERYTVLNSAWKDGDFEADDEVADDTAKLIQAVYNTVAAEKIDGDDDYQVAQTRANMLIGELRANKIPARQVFGVAFGDGKRTLDQAKPHAWVEAFMPSSGWITLDPNFEQHGNYFGVADAQRIALGLRGFDADFPPDSAKNYTISYVDEDQPATPTMQPELKATKYMILPGVALEVISVDMPAGMIVDNAGVRVGDAGAIHHLGSVAPLQKIRLRSLGLLASAFSSESVMYGIFPNGQAGEGSQEVAKVTSSVSYLPMLGLIAVGVLLYVSKFGIHTLRSRLGAHGSSTGGNATQPAAKDSLVVSSDVSGDSIEALDMLPEEEFEDEPADDVTDVKDAQEVEEQQPPAAKPQQIMVQTPMQQQPLSSDKPRLSALKAMPIEHAQTASPRLVQREIRRRRPPLIQ